MKHLRFLLCLALVLPLPAAAVTLSSETQARICARVARNFSGQAWLRVNERLERRLGFHCAPTQQLPLPVTPRVQSTEYRSDLRVSPEEQFMRRILTGGVWSRKNENDTDDIYEFNLLGNTYTFGIVNTAAGKKAEAGRWYLEEKSDGLHLILKPTDQEPCEAMPCEVLISYEKLYDKLKIRAADGSFTATLDHRRK